MSKSRASKTKAAGAAVWMDRYKRQYGYQFADAGKILNVPKPNRMIRRAQGK